MPNLIRCCSFSRRSSPRARRHSCRLSRSEAHLSSRTWIL